MKLNLILNGEDVVLGGDPQESLFTVLKRESAASGHQRLFDDHVCCQKGTCCRCHVALDGREVPSCLVPFYQVRQRELVTIEGFRHTEEYRKLRKVLEDEGLVECKQCTDAQIFHIYNFLEQFPGCTAQEWKSAIGEIPCRCGSRPALERGCERYLALREASRAGRR